MTHYPDDTPQQHRYGYQVELTAVDRGPLWRGDTRPEAHPLVRRLTEDALAEQANRIHSDPHDLARAYVLDGLRRDAHGQ